MISLFGTQNNSSPCHHEGDAGTVAKIISTRMVVPMASFSPILARLQESADLAVQGRSDCVHEPAEALLRHHLVCTANDRYTQQRPEQASS